MIKKIQFYHIFFLTEGENKNQDFEKHNLQLLLFMHENTTWQIVSKFYIFSSF